MSEWSIPEYTELKEIGSGGFGRVMLARHNASGTLVAIKYLRADLLADLEFARMFRDEAQVLASIDDPNVVRLYEYVESSAGAAIVMELVEGVSLREILAHQGATTPEAALVVLQGSLLGLAAAHGCGVVHRDYKPENVLVNGGGNSKLTDFGLAARAGDRPLAAGTLKYVAPEQIDGAPASPASDVYAATATFYECLIGHPPFSGEPDELLRQHHTEPVPLDPVPVPLRPLIAVGMAKDPGSRPSDATTLVDRLRSAASTTYGPGWERRGRSHLGEAALLLAALWPSGVPPAVQGTTVERFRLRRHLRLRHLNSVKAAIAVGAAAAVVAAGTALAASLSHRHPAGTRASQPPVAVDPVAVGPSGSGPPPVSPTPAPSATAAPSPTATPSPTSTSSPSETGGPSPSTGPPPQQASPPVPQIAGVSTYTSGQLVYFVLDYSDPGNDAEGFGFMGINGSGWAEEQHPFSSPSYGIVGQDSIAYPFNLECGTSSQVAQSYVEAWIYDTAGTDSDPVDIELVCSDSPAE
jgi:eukaryotic-like serine/threonine-protein kinase